MAKGKLTDKERMLVDTYLTNGFSKANAYLTVYGCAESTAKAQSYYTFNRPEVKQYLEKRRKEIYDNACIDADVVMSKLVEIAFAPKEDKYYTTKDKLKALDLLQKQLGLQKQKLEADVNTDINIVIEE